MNRPEPPPKRPDSPNRPGPLGRPEPDGKRDPRRSVLPGNRYAAIVGLVFVIVAAIALFNFVTRSEPGTIGFGGEETGMELPPFAMPEARSDLEGDANIEADQACRVDELGAIRSCDFLGKPLVVSFWFTRGGDCTEQQDVVSAAAEELGDAVAFLSVNVRDDRERVRELAEERGWRIPVAHDRDGAVSTLYKVGGCPTFVYVRPDGRLHDASIGELPLDELVTRARRLARETAGSDAAATQAAE